MFSNLNLSISIYTREILNPDFLKKVGNGSIFQVMDAMLEVKNPRLLRQDHIYFSSFFITRLCYT
jgi:hypothetical protein